MSLKYRNPSFNKTKTYVRILAVMNGTIPGLVQKKITLDIVPSRLPKIDEYWIAKGAFNSTTITDSIHSIPRLLQVKRYIIKQELKRLPKLIFNPISESASDFNVKLMHFISPEHFLQCWTTKTLRCCP